MRPENFRDLDARDDALRVAIMAFVLGAMFALGFFAGWVVS